MKESITKNTPIQTNFIGIASLIIVAVLWTAWTVTTYFGHEFRIANVERWQKEHDVFLSRSDTILAMEQVKSNEEDIDTLRSNHQIIAEDIKEIRKHLLGTMGRSIEPLRLESFNYTGTEPIGGILE